MTGIILAGGKSSRMGEDKGFLKIGKKTYTEILINTLNNIFDDVIIIANNQDYNQFGIPVFEDLYTNKGPLAGIFTGLKKSKTDINFFIPCDSPFLNEQLIKQLMVDVNNHDAVIPTFNNRVYPLTAFYSKTCIPQFEDALINNRLKVKAEIENINHKLVAFGNEFEKNFINFNSPEDISKYNK